MNDKSLYTIKAVSEKTGLAATLIRAWEKRYNAVTPERTDSQRRLYSEKDVEKLQLLKVATGKGYVIKNIANLSIEELEALIEDSGNTSSGKISLPQFDNIDEERIAISVEAIKQFDSRKLESIISTAGVEYSQPVLFSKFLIPLMYRIGDLWETGELRIAHEHLASEVVKNYLLNIIRGYKSFDNAPKLLAATPRGQLHEIGVLIAAAAAAAKGWSVLYVGADLPYNEIAFSAASNNVNALVLGIIYPPDDLRLKEDLLDLSKSIGENIKVVITGKGAANYAEAIKKAGASIANTPAEFIRLLES